MKVSQLMTAYAPTCRDDSAIEDAEILLRIDRGPFPVTDREGRVVGILRRTDIRCAHRRAGHPARVCEAMLKDVRPCFESDDVQVALDRMEANRLRRLPVVDAKGKLVGSVCLVDPDLEAGEDASDACPDPAASSGPTVVDHRSPSLFDRGPSHPS